MPSYAQLLRWRRDNPWLEDALQRARKGRGELFFEKALTAVEEAVADRDEVALAKLRSDVYRSAAKVYDSNFAETQKVSAEVGVSLVKADTGIRRPGDVGFVDVSLALQSGGMSEAASESGEVVDLDELPELEVEDD
jgi:hypothetical protein